MSTFESRIKPVTNLDLPKFSGIRILLMPFHLHDIDNTIPEFLNHWKSTLKKLSNISKRTGTGYVTIDEAYVTKGTCHRRPGIHTDGSGAWGSGGSGCWGGGKAQEKRLGMLLVSNAIGCRGWNQTINGEVGEDGDCSHLSEQLKPENEITMQPNVVYACNPGAVHESIPLTENANRQFVRISMPSTHDWYESCTPNPLGVLPEGNIKPARTTYMSYRP